MRRLPLLPVLLLLLACATAQARGTPTDTPDQQAKTLFAADWLWRLQTQPELATALGDVRFNNQLTDMSLAASVAGADHERSVLAQARAIDAGKLSASNHLSLDILIDQKERRLKAIALFPYRYAPLTNQDGLALTLPRLVVQMPFTSEADYRAYLARLEALPAHIDGVIEQMREGQRLGWSAPKTALRQVPALLHQLREALASGVVGQPFREIPATIARPQREELAAAGAAVLRTRVAPALLKLEEYVRLEALPGARETVAIAAVPGGAEYYQLLVSEATELSPAAVHALGLKEVARLRGEMQTAIARTGFSGSFAQFAVFANSDARLFASDPERLLNRYRRQLARATAAAPRLFNAAPAEALAVRAMQDGSDDQGAAYYEAASEGRVAAIVVNTTRLNTRPLWETESLVLHEGIPGHHLQVARARELSDLPAFRRHAWFAPYGEGWAMYAESLGHELGFYADPFSAFGKLNSDLLRSARLVADTGIHAMGWSRQQAIDYLNANTANAQADNEVEVDRYIAAPGQALAYKLGQLRFKALRDKAQAALGERFDLRRFHGVLLDNGALPLSLLDQQVERWIRASATPAKTAAPGAG
jgi:uncharacterized protein (DUF885 family)